MFRETILPLMFYIMVMIKVWWVSNNVDYWLYFFE